MLGVAAQAGPRSVRNSGVRESVNARWRGVKGREVGCVMGQGERHEGEMGGVGRGGGVSDGKRRDGRGR